MSIRPYFPSKPIKLDYIYFHVGRVSVLWADAEQALDRIIEIFAQANPQPLYAAPISTKRRIKTFRSQMVRIKLTDDQRARGSDLIDRFENLAWYRHWTTHGSVEEISMRGETWRGQKGLVSFLRQNLSTREFEVHDLHLNDIEAMGDEALDLYVGLVEWKALGIGCSTTKKIEKFCGEGGMRLGRILPLGKARDDAA